MSELKPLERAQIGFNLGNERIEFIVVHNLEQFGLSIESAFDNWINRTDEYDVNSFCDYVKSKDPSIMCLHEKLESKLNKKYEAK